MQKALITGAGGFCARHLVRLLNEEGQMEILGIDRHVDRPAKVVLDCYIQTDVSDQIQVTDVIRRFRPDYVFHLAGSSTGSAEDIYQTNLMGTLYLLEALRSYAPDARVLLAGSAAEYGQVSESVLPITEKHPCRPIGNYGVSKHAMTLAGLDYVQRFGMKIVIARTFNIIGAGVPQHLVAGAVLRQAKHAFSNGGDLVIKVGDLSTKRDFVAVNDVVGAFMQMVQGNYWGQVFNLCSGRPYLIRDMVDLLLSNSPHPIKVEVDSCLLRSSDIAISYGSWEKANRTFGFEPIISIEEVLREAWFHEMKGLF